MTLAVVSEAYHVFRGWALHNAARGIVVRPVAWAEIAAPLASLGDRHTSKVRADAKNNAPLRFLCALSVGSRIAQFSLVLVVNGGDLISSEVANEDRLASPLDRRAVPRPQFPQIVFRCGDSHYVG